MTILKRSISIHGHRTSISLEEEFWLVLKSLAAARPCSLAELVSEVDEQRSSANLSSALRVYVLHQVLGRGEGDEVELPESNEHNPPSLTPPRSSPDS